MGDGLLAVMWLVVLVAGVAAVVAARRLGASVSGARDMLHVGAGVWVLGWPYWSSALAPGLIVLGALGTVLAMPRLARQMSWAEAIERSVSNERERWLGLVWYAAAFAVATWVGLLWRPFPAAGALLALSLGDGLGGAVGQRVGKHRYRLPNAKSKSLEGSLTVAVMAGLGVALAGWWMDVSTGWAIPLAAGALAATAEALSPRGTDNFVVPAAVWCLLTAAGPM